MAEMYFAKALLSIQLFKQVTTGVLLLAGLTGQLHAGSFDGNNSSEKTVTFTEPAPPLSLNVTQNLNYNVAGSFSSGAPVANIKINALKPSSIGWRWNLNHPGQETIPRSWNATITGRNNPDNKLPLIMGGGNYGSQWIQVGDDFYWTTNNKGVLSYNALLQTPIGTRTDVKADRYSVLIDAAVYVE